jgi:acyl dehydratase
VFPSIEGVDRGQSVASIFEARSNRSGGCAQESPRFRTALSEMFSVTQPFVRSFPILTGIDRQANPEGSDMYFEDYVPGTVSILRTETVSEASIIEFARQYDPQDMHINPQAAAEGPFGGVIASGWHTCALAGHALVTEYLSPESSLPSPAIEEVRWRVPVRASDTLTWRATVLEARPSRSNSSRGIVRTRLEATNQDGNLAVSMTAINLIRRRPVTGA